MRNKKIKIIFAVVAILIGIFVVIKIKGKHSESEITKEIKPTVGTIQSFISTTATVLPQNRLQIKPPVNGRIDSILVKEGDKVKTGQILAWMSSTDRAALLDAARGQGADALKYWKEVYKGIPLLSPIDGEVIVATTQPGQTVTTSEAVVVLSDHLIVRAQVDETDIGKIELGQEASITLDAYLGEKIKALVSHIYYESQTVNNVTIYNVDLAPESIPVFFRSGMNATVDFKAEDKNNALLLPVEAVRKEKGENYVLLKQEGDKSPLKRSVKIGITDDKNIEIISGIDANDIVIVKSKKYILPSANKSKNPFMPSRPEKKKSN
ncbi:MAG: efflux RND transporter periplasmic adaptor subunit [Candidatus Omnitrophica bacterium]|nr:efflux RND transporter periplasmic adaptor subunit [Candidatus Omnitrophota bacterium]